MQHLPRRNRVAVSWAVRGAGAIPPFWRGLVNAARADLGTKAWVPRPTRPFCNRFLTCFYLCAIQLAKMQLNSQVTRLRGGGMLAPRLSRGVS